MDKVIIIGAGPSGLAAGYCLAGKDIKPLIIEKDSQVGGLSKTIKYKGYRFDIGGHRFFTDLEEVGAFWGEILEDKLIKKRCPPMSKRYPLYLIVLLNPPT